MTGSNSSQFSLQVILFDQLQIRNTSKDIGIFPRRVFCQMNVRDFMSSDSSEVPTEPYSSADENEGDLLDNEVCHFV